jgi:gliding motility-associated-like protein
MIKKAFILLIVFYTCIISLSAQPCTTLGQTPETAFPVCGTTAFLQETVPACGGRTITAPTCTDAVLSDINPYWYKFTCFETGTLAFSLTPNTPSDDYDWQLFDVTGRNPSDVYTDPSLFVACNWSGEPGTTGASAAGTSLIVCATTTNGPFRPVWSAMPTLQVGHNYLLLVSHFTVTSQSGYSLTFGGGTADITDPGEPALSSLKAACDGTEITIKLSKKMKCSSLSTNGSEFTITPFAGTVTAARSAQCTNGFDMDSVTLTLSQPLMPGNYTVTIQNGTDLTTLLDNCDRNIPAGSSLPITILPLLPTPMDSLAKIGCAPQTLELVFKKPIKCSTIEPGGSDFTVSGPSPITIISASGNCVDGFTSKIILQLDTPIVKGGNYIITLRNGTDGNTLFDECGQESLEGITLAFSAKDTVNADFTHSIIYGCDKNTVLYQHDGLHSVNSWQWKFDDQPVNTQQNPVITYTNYREKRVQLIVTNGVCSDTASTTVFFDNLLEADFEITNLVCPEDKAIIKNHSVGNVITDYSWNFGNGSLSTMRDPAPLSYTNPVINTIQQVQVRLVIKNDYGCFDTAVQTIRVVNNCFIAVPSAFTPNGDGLNDYLFPLNAYKALNLSFSVYNRFGQRMYYTNDWTQKWDGRFKGQPADPATYVWILDYIHSDTQKRVQQKGSTILIR